jgi:hypothetical protein
MKFSLNLSLKLKRDASHIKNFIFLALCKNKPKVATVCLKLLNRVQEVPALGLGLNSGSPDYCSSFCPPLCQMPG